MKCPGCDSEIPKQARFCPKCGLKQRYIPDDPLNGAKINDRYLILELIGEGGSGKVYLARDIQGNKRVALKLLHKELIGDPTAILRFRREAEAVKNLENPHIIKIFELGETHDRLPFIVMEYLEGETLASKLSKLGAFTFDEALDIVIQVCDGLMEAHAMGFIHRDLRPRNIMLTNCCGKENFVKILDFGVAKILPTGPDPSKSFIGFVMGDATYTAPELFLGKQVSPGTDIYSLGIIFYQLITGHPPFMGNTVVNIMHEHMKKPYPPLEDKFSGVPKGIDIVLSKALAKHPLDRYSTVFQFKESLEKLRENSNSSNTIEAISLKENTHQQRDSEKYYNLNAPFNGAEGEAFRIPGGGVVRVGEHQKVSPEKFIYLEKSPVQELYETYEEAWNNGAFGIPSEELVEKWKETKKTERLIWIGAILGLLLIIGGGILIAYFAFDDGDVIIEEEHFNIKSENNTNKEVVHGVNKKQKLQHTNIKGKNNHITTKNSTDIKDATPQIKNITKDSSDLSNNTDSKRNNTNNHQETKIKKKSKNLDRRATLSTKNYSTKKQDNKKLSYPKEEIENLISKARTKFNNGEFSAAEILYKTVLKKAPNNIKAILGLESVYFETGRYKLSEKLLEKAVKSHRSARLWYRLGVVRKKLGKISLARKAYEKALEISPGYKPALSALQGI